MPCSSVVPSSPTLFSLESREEIAPPDEIPFIDRTLELTVEQKLRPAKKMAITYGLGFGRKHVYQANPDLDSPLPPLDFRTDIARLTSTYAWDTRDDPTECVARLVPLLGNRVWGRGARQRPAFHPVSGSAGPTSSVPVRESCSPRHSAWEPAAVSTRSSSRSERFFAGGGTSVRGFEEDGLGPQSVLGGATGGDALLVFNQELRVRPRRWLGAVAFFDAGNVFARPGEMSFTKLEAGAGAGVRFISPFAILRVDFGIPLTSRNRQSRGLWYFGIGHTF